jgi:Bifunctional DNA primase/polymerase, N-terminal/Primase C terminal 1 (PriCT-1)
VHFVRCLQSGQPNNRRSILTQTVLDCAMHYSRLGLAVLPLHYPVSNKDGSVCSCGRSNCTSPAKHPVGHLVSNGTKNSTTEPQLLERWFKGTSWNVGIVTGSKSGIIAADVDPRHGGDETIAKLEQENGRLPRTWQFLTGGGGHHSLFRPPGGIVPNSAGKLGAGVDIRGENGFIVAPPSLHICGRPYAISVDHHPEDIPLAEPPPWLTALVKSDAPVRVSTQEWRKRIGSIFPEGQRNDSLTRVCGHLLAHGIDRHVCLDIILSLNATHCTPPLSEPEILNIVASITMRELARKAPRHKEWSRG